MLPAHPFCWDFFDPRPETSHPVLAMSKMHSENIFWWQPFKGRASSSSRPDHSAHFEQNHLWKAVNLRLRGLQGVPKNVCWPWDLDKKGTFSPVQQEISVKSEHAQNYRNRVIGTLVGFPMLLRTPCRVVFLKPFCWQALKFRNSLLPDSKKSESPWLDSPL